MRRTRLTRMSRGYLCAADPGLQFFDGRRDACGWEVRYCFGYHSAWPVGRLPTLAACRDLAGFWQRHQAPVQGLMADLLDGRESALGPLLDLLEDLGLHPNRRYIRRMLSWARLLPPMGRKRRRPPQRDEDSAEVRGQKAEVRRQPSSDL